MSLYQVNSLGNQCVQFLYDVTLALFRRKIAFRNILLRLQIDISFPIDRNRNHHIIKHRRI